MRPQFCAERGRLATWQHRNGLDLTWLALGPTWRPRSQRCLDGDPLRPRHPNWTQPVLRPPVESSQNTRRFDIPPARRRGRALPSIGSVGDSYANALAEPTTGLYKTESCTSTHSGRPSKRSRSRRSSGSTGGTPSDCTPRSAISRHSVRTALPRRSPAATAPANAKFPLNPARLRDRPDRLSPGAERLGERPRRPVGGAIGRPAARSSSRRRMSASTERRACAAVRVVRSDLS